MRMAKKRRTRMEKVRTTYDGKKKRDKDGEGKDHLITMAKRTRMEKVFLVRTSVLIRRKTTRLGKVKLY